MRLCSPALPALALVVSLPLASCADGPSVADTGLAPDARDALPPVDQPRPDHGLDASVTDGQPADAAGDAAPPDAAPADAAAPDGPTSGTLAVLTYNVAGLPWGLSQSDPVKNTPPTSIPPRTPRTRRCWPSCCSRRS